MKEFDPPKCQYRGRDDGLCYHAMYPGECSRDKCVKKLYKKGTWYDRPEEIEVEIETLKSRSFF